MRNATEMADKHVAALIGAGVSCGDVKEFRAWYVAACGMSLADLENLEMISAGIKLDAIQAAITDWA